MFVDGLINMRSHEIEAIRTLRLATRALGARQEITSCKRGAHKRQEQRLTSVFLCDAQSILRSAEPSTKCERFNLRLKVNPDSMFNADSLLEIVNVESRARSRSTPIPACDN